MSEALLSFCAGLNLTSFVSKRVLLLKNPHVQESLKIHYIEFNITVPPLTINQKPKIKNKNESL